MLLKLFIDGQWRELTVDLDMQVVDSRVIPTPRTPATDNLNEVMSHGRRIAEHLQAKHIQDLRDDGTVVEVKGARTEIKRYSSKSISITAFIANAAKDANFKGPPGTEALAAEIFQEAEKVRQKHGEGCPDCVLGEVLRPFHKSVREALAL